MNLSCILLFYSLDFSFPYCQLNGDMINDNPIRGIQCRLRDALNMINNIKLSDVSSIEELVELRKEFQPLHDKFNKFLIKLYEK